MASNITTTCFTKHVDIKYKYVNEYMEEGVVKIVSVNFFTKNLSAELQREALQENGSCP